MYSGTSFIFSRLTREAPRIGQNQIWHPIGVLQWICRCEEASKRMTEEDEFFQTHLFTPLFDGLHELSFSFKCIATEYWSWAPPKPCKCRTVIYSLRNSVESDKYLISQRHRQVFEPQRHPNWDTRGQLRMQSHGSIPKVVYHSPYWKSRSISDYPFFRLMVYWHIFLQTVSWLLQ